MINIPSVRALRVLEACARLESFTAAADELSVTQSAISQQIKLLEQTVGFRLFERTGRRVALSEAGRRLLQAVRHGFGHIQQAIEEEKSRDAGTDLVIAVQPGFSVRWLLPRLSRFRQAHPQVRLTVKSVIDTTDFDRSFAHVGIVYSVRPGEAFLFTEHLYPVAAPRFARQHGLLASPDEAELGRRTATLPLLGETTDETRNTVDTWRVWSMANGVQLEWSDIQRYSQSNISLELAQLGQGIAMGRSSLVMDAIAEGKLVPLMAPRTVSPCGYSLVINPQARANDSLPAFRHWLAETAMEIGHFEARLADFRLTD
ncbi:LysR family transcriptional regulator [Stappia indica]|uniref:LysR family transcriptional regulator n=1 Tax=Stappia indica TaxID=538381 RepID=UPI001CD253CE|nr:LysR family transcriptional regulator [Stappia indica]MCA1297579.1 LysR family transcriptional regulator [Stappia indica]